MKIEAGADFAAQAVEWMQTIVMVRSGDYTELIKPKSSAVFVKAHVKRICMCNQCKQGQLFTVIFFLQDAFWVLDCGKLFQNCPIFIFLYAAKPVGIYACYMTHQLNKSDNSLLKKETVQYKIRYNTIKIHYNKVQL